jgi:ribose transport system ATP-binding protein
LTARFRAPSGARGGVDDGRQHGREESQVSGAILSLRNVTKSFPGVLALKSVSFDVQKGHIHGLVGENGAGKSTLMKILSGVYRHEQGEIYFDGNKLGILTPARSQEIGISIIHQEFNLLPTLSIAENIFVNRLAANRGIVNWRLLNSRSAQLLEDIGYSLNVQREVRSLSVAQKQMVEIAKALSHNSKLILMDEPSASLTSKELRTFFEVISGLKAKGITIIYISHKIDEIFRLCDTVTVLRDGAVIDTKPVSQCKTEEIIQKIVGRTIENEFPSRHSVVGEEILRVSRFHVKEKVKDVSFSLRRGEILGIIGLVGSGRTELVRAIFGADRKSFGTVSFGGRDIDIRSPRDAIRSRIALLTEDRRQQGLFIDYSIRMNIAATNMGRISRNGFLDSRRERHFSKDFIRKLMIKTPSEEQRALYLSGGNQQKVVIAKWLFSEPEVLIMDEPTRGIDVGAKYEIYLLMNELVASGKSIIFISSELPEVLAMSDRVLVLYNGELRGEYGREDLHSEKVIKSVIGQN